MSMLSEWALAIHRAVWFPVMYAAGLEREPIEVPEAFAPVAAGQLRRGAPTRLRVVKRGKAK
jgi:hypothetical protein